MKTNNPSISNHSKSNIKKFFDNKGSLASISEKSNTNLEYIKLSLRNKEKRVYHFAVGHKFKNLPLPESVLFRKEYVEEKDKYISTDFKALQEEIFISDGKNNTSLHAKLNTWLGNIRNLNNHYVHDFKKVRLTEENSVIKPFLIDSFRMATMGVFLNQKDSKGKTRWDYIKDKALENCIKENKNYSADLLSSKQQEEYIRYIDRDNIKKEYNKFLKEKFKKELESIDESDNLNTKECIENILFFNVEEDFEWKIRWKEDEDSIMIIESGEYISFTGSLFLMAMFLYKDEAEMLISKIKFLKDTSTESFREKRNIISFFSKKLSSQDYSSEEKHLVYFRDIIQYLNKYPTIWNRDTDLDNETDNDFLTSIRESIEKMEIDRLFPTMKEDNEFKEYAINHIFRDKEVKPKKRIYKDIIEKNDEVRALYDIIRNNPSSIKEKEYKDNTFKQYVLKYVVNNYYKNNDTLEKFKAKRFDRWKEKEFEEELNTNKKVKKLKERLKSKLFYTSYGRNQDRFMETAIRFLAEENYFGKDAKFKMYQFYTTDEQNNYLDEQNRELKHLKERGTKEEYIEKKKSIDGLKYHGGKLTEYRTYDDHKSSYPEWDTPFVVENNSVQVIIPNKNDEKKGIRLSLQRSLMVYILQDYLFNKEKPKKGKELFIRYFYGYYQKDYKSITNTISKNGEKDFSLMSKLLPSRAIQQMFSETKLQTSLEAFRKILDEAKENEKRYNEKLKNKRKISEEASEEVYENFIKKNKGKQFKLNFIRKAWHLMYFKDIYKKYAPTKADHHKSLHITRDEYNDFCRYMFAMDTVPHYKELLRGMLFEKGFFENDTFKRLFDGGKTLEWYYEKTKEIFEKWIEDLEKSSAAETLQDREKYSLYKYHNLNYTEDDVDNKIFYINLSHFISYLRKENRLMTEVKEGEERIILPAVSQNKVNLIGDYYKDLSKDKSIRKKCKQLMKTCFEDCLLYEIALRYFGREQEITKNIRTNVKEILNQNTLFPINDKNGKFIYNIEVPFNQIEKYVGLVTHKSRVEKKYDSFLSDIPTYLKDSSHSDKNITEIGQKIITSKKISLEDFNKIQRHVVTESRKFLIVYMDLEKYFISKYEIKIPNEENNIEYKDINELNSYVSKDDRDTACHFGIPKPEAYNNLIKEIETKFIKQEVKGRGYKSYDEIDSDKKEVLYDLLNTIHNNLYYFRIIDKEERARKAKERYFKEIVQVNYYNNRNSKKG